MRPPGFIWPAGAHLAEFPGLTNVKPIPENPLLLGTILSGLALFNEAIARRFTTAPVADSQRLCPLPSARYSKLALARIAKGDGFILA